MSLPSLIRDLQACVADGEWERAGAYFDDLRRDLQPQALARASLGARNAGAVVTSLRGLAGALDAHDAPRAAAALRNLSYVLDERPRPSA